jgi:hypothetical protein
VGLSKGTANKVGACGLLITLLFWAGVLTPFGRTHGFHGDIIVTKGAVLAALACAIVAVANGTRWWLISLVLTLFTAAIAIIAPL